MATINIAFGGQNVGVEIPDIALESTMKDVLAEANAQTQMLANIAQAIGAKASQTQQVQKNTTRELANAIKEGNKDRRSMMGTLLSRSRQMFGDVGKSAMGITGKESLSDMTGSFAGAIGLGKIGAQIGSVFGIMEEFGNSMGALRRVGTGYLENLQDLRSGAASIGLGLEGLGKIVTENGVTIRSLGNNTTEGTQALINMTKQFRENTRAAGFFGMQSEEMARLLTDEAEIRRRIMGTDMRTEEAQAEMVQSLEQQLKLNESMAKLTGQDIRERIKASQDFRSDATNAAILASLNQEQAQAAKSAVEGLSQLGPTMQGPVQQALTNMLGGFDMFTNNLDFAGFAQMAEAAGVDVRGAMQNISNMIASGADDTTIQAATDQLANSLRNIDPAMLIQQSIGGNQGAAAVLQTRVEAVSTGAESMAGSIDKINTSMDELSTAIANQTTALSGTAAQMEKAAQEFRNTLMDSLLKAFEVDNLASSTNGFNQFIDRLADLPSNEQFQGFVQAMTDLTTLTSGAQGLVKIMQNQDSSNIQGAYLGAAFAEAAGLDKVAAGLRGLGNALLPFSEEGKEIVETAIPNLGPAFKEALDEFRSADGSLRVNMTNMSEFIAKLSDLLLDPRN